MSGHRRRSHNDAAKSQGRRLAIAVVCIVLMVLAWRIIAVSLGDVLELHSPRAALAWHGGDSDALSVVASSRMVQGDGAGAEQAAKAALAIDPLNSRSIQTLGLIAGARGDASRADALMKQASRLSKRNTIAEAWLFDLEMSNAHYPAAMDHADALLRRRTGTAPKLLSVLVETAGFMPAMPALAQKLAQMPPWRAAIFSAFGKSDTNVDLSPFLAKLDSVGAPAGRDEVAMIVTEMARRGDFPAALSVARKIAPASGKLINGSFDGKPGIPPFAWTFPAGEAGHAAIMMQDKRRKALRIEPDSRGRPGILAQQVVSFAPGTYEFTGNVEKERSGDSGVATRIRCAPPSRTTLFLGGEAAFEGKWLPFSGTFTVPAGNCAVQRIEIISTGALPTEGAVSWYDDLAISGQGNE